uniref:Protein shisa-5 n=1 Tax=Laticauda laticaudata TaxID=8630 RepID=A0A8C5RGS5_LATLA
MFFSGTFIAIGISIFVVFVVGIILCFTCSCCCLYKACRRRPQPVVTTSTSVIQVPYPQQPGIPVAYAGGAYQGYNPLPVQPQAGMPAAPYPTQYPPPYPTHPIRPPPYQETVAGKERRGERCWKEKRNKCVVMASFSLAFFSKYVQMLQPSYIHASCQMSEF